MNITLEKQEAVLLFLYCGDDRNETVDNLQQIEDKDFEAALILADDTV